MRGVEHNPFCAARFAPGVLPWFEEFPGSLEAMAARACRRGARFQILGPHGSGKTTLLRQLERHARGRGLSVLAARGSRAPLGVLARALRVDLVLLDEVEELGRSRFALLSGLLALRGVGLVVSAHRDLGFETLAQRSIDPRLSHRVVSELLAGSGLLPPDLPELAGRLELHQGNLREVLFDLYDAVERGALGRMD